MIPVVIVWICIDVPVMFALARGTSFDGPRATWHTARSNKELLVPLKRENPKLDRKFSHNKSEKATTLDLCTLNCPPHTTAIPRHLQLGYLCLSTTCIFQPLGMLKSSSNSSERATAANAKRKANGSQYDPIVRLCPMPTAELTTAVCSLTQRLSRTVEGGPVSWGQNWRPPHLNKNKRGDCTCT